MCIFPLPELLYLEIYQSVCYEHFVGKNFFFLLKYFIGKNWQVLGVKEYSLHMQLKSL